MFLQTYIGGLVGWELAKGVLYNFSLLGIFCTADPFVVTNSSQLWREKKWLENKGI